MLQPLDPQRLDALARGDGDGDDEGIDLCLHHRMKNIRKNTKEGQDWGNGVLAILREAGDFVTTIQRTRYLTCEERKGSDEWFIDFYDFPFQDLSVRPSPGGAVDVCTHGKSIKSFQIMGCRKNWVAMVRWIWEYGEKIAMMKSKREAQKKSRKTGRRVEKPLLHKVLHPARFKAQPKEKTSAKDAAAPSDNTDVMMEDLGTTMPSCNPVSHPAGFSRPDDQSTPNATTEDVDISTLKVTDQGS